jgi:hypothetical protein
VALCVCLESEVKFCGRVFCVRLHQVHGRCWWPVAQAARSKKPDILQLFAGGNHGRPLDGKLTRAWAQGGAAAAGGVRGQMLARSHGVD